VLADGGGQETALSKPLHRGRAASLMTRISSGVTFLYKRIFPIFWFGFLAVFVATAFLSGQGIEKDPLFLVIPCGMGVVGFFIMKKLVWDLVDEVYDDQDFLLVKNRGEEERVALSNIMNVSATTFVNPPRVTLKLVEPGRFGSEITFTPVKGFNLNPFAKNPIVEDLIVRVDKARTNRAS
jgi:hypothetical protein